MEKGPALGTGEGSLMPVEPEAALAAVAAAAAGAAQGAGGACRHDQMSLDLAGCVIR